MTTRDELVMALAGRHAAGSRVERGRMLDEFAAGRATSAARDGPALAAIRRSVAVRTFDDWDDPPAGFMAADLVAHGGPTAEALPAIADLDVDARAGIKPPGGYGRD